MIIYKCLDICPDMTVNKEIPKTNNTESDSPIINIITLKDSIILNRIINNL